LVKGRLLVLALLDVGPVTLLLVVYVGDVVLGPIGSCSFDPLFSVLEVYRTGRELLELSLVVLLLSHFPELGLSVLHDD
jgi:hypothetical protein